jgi:ubiquinone/menaquinone biosynthesis C-methylase UbiE
MSSNAIFTNSIAENYEKYMGPIFFEPYAKDMADRLSSGSVHSLLEVACGTAQVTRLLKERFPDAKIVATDLNPGMLELAKRIVSPEDKIEWLIANAEELPFDDNEFDAVICQFGLMFVPDKQKAVKEAYRVLKQGGRFLFNTWDRIEKNHIYKIASDVLISYFKDNPPDFFDVPFSMYDSDEMESLLKSAGFGNVSVENVQFGGCATTAKDMAKALSEGTPAYLAICERDEKLLPEIQKTLSDEIKKVFGSSSFKIPLYAFLAEGVK